MMQLGTRTDSPTANFTDFSLDNNETLSSFVCRFASHLVCKNPDSELPKVVFGRFDLIRTGITAEKLTKVLAVVVVFVVVD